MGWGQPPGCTEPHNKSVYEQQTANQTVREKQQIYNLLSLLNDTFQLSQDAEHVHVSSNSLSIRR